LDQDALSHPQALVLGLQTELELEAVSKVPNLLLFRMRVYRYGNRFFACSHTAQESQTFLEQYVSAESGAATGAGFLVGILVTSLCFCCTKRWKEGKYVDNSIRL